MTNTKRGAPKRLSDTARVTMVLERSQMHEADALVPLFDGRSQLGVRHARIDVLRAAVRLGLEALRSEAEKGGAR
jgi:hypothetical protein